MLGSERTPVPRQHLPTPMTPSRRGPNNDPIYHQHHLQHYPDAPQHQSHLPQAASAQPQYLVLPNAINDVEPLDIFLDPAMGTPLPIFVEKDVVNHEVINALIKVNFQSIPALECGLDGNGYPNCLTPISSLSLRNTADSPRQATATCNTS